MERLQCKPNARVRRARHANTKGVMERLKIRYSVRSGIARVYPKIKMFPTFSKLYGKLKGFTQSRRSGKI